MRLTCEHCLQGFDVPEDKVPQAKGFRFRCPSCKKSNQVRLSEDRAQVTPQEEEEGLEVTPVRVGPGISLALMLVKDEQIASEVRTYFTSRGWEIIEVQEARMGRAYVQVNRIQGVVLEDSESGLEVLKEVHRLPGTQRREMHCVLVGDRAESFDSMTAFLLGVNSYLRPEDAPGLEAALDKTHTQFDHYRQLWLAGTEQ
ncbi:MAG: zinc-ribbon domain-containing protein [Thermodesulfobacteriota bacterium]